MAALLVVAPAAAFGSAWDELRTLRAGLEADSPLVADFEQVFQPAGFSSGERETGRVALGLPACLRWDYLDPFPNSYLVCGAIAWSWNPGEASGRRFALDPAAQPGLDLLRLEVAELRERYRATSDAAAADRIVVRLEPLGDDDIRQATLTIDTRSRRLLALSFRDLEGNLTRFAFAGYRRLEEGQVFEAPRIEWLED